MTTKKKTVAVAKADQIEAERQTCRNRAPMALGSSVNAAAVICEYGKPFGKQDMVALVEELTVSIGTVHGGDLKQCEAMLMGQAHALQSIFMNFSRRALAQEYQSNLESFFRMALKAQNQCRMTLETLATIKNPPVVFAKQANIAHGPQQVNNGLPTHAREEKTIQSNELLNEGGQHGPALDNGGTGATGGADKELAPVGAIGGAKDGGR